MIKICIFGASGFVGRALVERLIQRQDVSIRAVVHSPGNSWSILRYNIPIIKADLNDISSIENAISGCSYVVNLALGPLDELINSAKNLVSACKKHSIKRLIHISSVTVYGDLPSHLSEFENGPVRAVKKSYGWYKNEQDKIMGKANKEGLSTIVLCPPHITGAYGRLFHQVIESIKAGTFALVDNGILPCNLVDINNICKAIELSFLAESSDGKRIFITNGDDYNWRDLVEQASIIAGVEFKTIPIITREEAKKLGNNDLSLVTFIKRLTSIAEVRSLAKKTKIIKWVYTSILNKSIVPFKKPRHILSFNKSSAEMDMKTNLNTPLIKQQLRGVRHNIEHARKVLEYRPIVSSYDSIKLFEDYYSVLYGYKSNYWDLNF